MVIGNSPDKYGGQFPIRRKGRKENRRIRDEGREMHSTFIIQQVHSMMFFAFIAS